jgi:hypothetical protein
MLSKKAVQRHQSAEEVLEAIDGVMAMLHGGRYPSGQFAALGNRTPGKPVTVPPPSRKSQQMPVTKSAEPEATRALDVADVQYGSGGGMDSERTMALDTSATSGSATANAATMALDLDAARAQLQAGKDNSSGGKGKGAKEAAASGGAKSAAPAQSGPSVRNLLLLLTIAVLVVGGAVIALLSGKEDAKGPAKAAEIANDDRGGGAGSADKSQAEKDKAEQELAEKAKADQEKADKEKADKEKADQEAAAKAAAEKASALPGSATPSQAGVAAAGQPPAGESRKVRLETTPPGATVLVDGKESCTTPCEVELKPNGGQKVTFKKAGHDTFELVYNDLYLLAPAKPVYPVTLTAAKSVIKKAKPKVEW